MTDYNTKSINKISDQIKFGKKVDFQKFISLIGIISILILATVSMAIADESFVTQSFSNSENEKNEPFTPRGHIEDFSWIKRVSVEGVIEISGIGFSIVNDDAISHYFEICSIVQGPIEKFTPALDSPLACITSKEIESNAKLINQLIKFPKGIKISELVDISIAIQEL